MYSRYPNYQHFDPMENLLSRAAPDGTPVREETGPVLPEAPVKTDAAPEGLGALSGLLTGVSGLGGLFGQGGKGGKGLGSLLGQGGKGLGGLGGLLGQGGKGLGGLLNGGLSGFLKNFSLNWDSGDILLVLILLFLSTESDDEEILLLLGMILFFGL